MPLGILPDGDFPTAPSIPLEAGDVLLLMTDGIHEARSPTGEQFGSERAFEVVRAQHGRSAREIVQALYDAVRDFGAGLQQAGDITALVKVGEG